MSNPNVNPPPDLNPEQLTRLLELELAHKRAEWKDGGVRIRKNRATAIVVLAVLLIAIALAFLFFF